MSSTKHLFITGGVVSSLGKGITAASVAMLLQRRGYRVAIQKLDPYLNVDPGTMSPYQHGEVYVTEDGAETDLDLGHYERFTDTFCTKNGNYTAGKIYQTVLQRERKGEYLGRTVQVIPHITNEIRRAIASMDEEDVDIVITEIGGTVGDIESLPFLEAIRQYRHHVGSSNAQFIHLTLVPYIAAAKELKTKPSQQSVGILREIGIMADFLVCRSEKPLEDDHIDKLALFCNVDKGNVIQEVDVENTIYEVPLDLYDQSFDTKILKALDLPAKDVKLEKWRSMVDTYINPENGIVNIAVVGKYVSLSDAYKSINEALIHGGIANSAKVKLQHIEAESIEGEDLSEVFAGIDGILVPGGFGDRGTEGKIKAIQYARENNVPYFGICLGMQLAVIETARNVAGLEDANSTELAENTKAPVISLMLEQRGITQMGGTMRLGAYPCVMAKGTKSLEAYGDAKISERHRHRYEFNNAFKDKLEAAGLIIAGTSPDGMLVEIVERADHPYFVACQFHPEFKSTPMNAHPLFRDFVKASLANRK
ncbi:MAG: CTP synthase [Lentisphaeraceae bacterium]|nr:CTP synthase [Lentisphaeraceae bacterium]